MTIKRKKTGLPPGSVIFTGNKKVEQVLIHYLQYDESTLIEDVLDNQEGCVFLQSPDDKVDWYDLRGLHDTQLIELIGKTFNIHPLVLEDVADINQRPKYEEYENGLFIVTKALDFDPVKMEVKTEQVAIFFRKGFLITFQEAATDLFQSVRDRVKNSSGRIRTRGADYLAYAIIDAVTDHYFIVLDKVEEVIESFEDSLLISPDSSIKTKIHSLKKEILQIRKTVSPLREAVSRFAKTDNLLIEDQTSLFIRDLHDHVVQIIDMAETYRDTLSGLHDLYLSEISFKMNQVMQVLTIITTIFVPLSFLAGLYGMNFKYIPELTFKYGYFVLLGVMFFILVSLILYFKNKKWL